MPASERAARFVPAQDRRRFARCRRALREILGGLLGEHAGSLRFRTIGRGKPELDCPGTAGGPPPLRFNVSHSSHLAVIAICNGRELGVDLEQQRPISEAERIVESFFSVAEQAEFATIAHEARSLAFVRGWTRKEAILKGLGVGIAGLADRHETGFGTGEMPRQFAPAVPCRGWASGSSGRLHPTPASWQPWPVRWRRRRTPPAQARSRRRAPGRCPPEAGADSVH